MKRLFTLLFVLASFSGFAQTDSSLQEVTTSWQARDLAYATNFIVSDAVYEDFYDSIKAKFRVPAPPSGTTIVTITGIKAGVLLQFFQFVRGINYAGLSIPFNRINNTLRATGNAWLIRKLDELDAAEQERYQTLIRIGNQRLRRQ